MSLPDLLVQEALRLVDDPGPLWSCEPVGGGDISSVVHLHTARGEYALKWGGRGLSGFFAAEADGLTLLGSSGAVRVPAVLGWRDETATQPGLIVLEWLAAPAGARRQIAAEQLGHELAALHRTTAPAFGLARDNYIGATPQPNGWNTSWLAFFRERRLGFQSELAQRHGYLQGMRAARMARLLDRLDSWLDDRLLEPALLHGDLWSGNYLVGPGGRLALIDPAVYYGDREADLAFTTLFGGFPETFYAAYAEEWPLPDGWRERRDLYNLYHLLNHQLLFGASYTAQVDQVLLRYGG